METKTRLEQSLKDAMRAQDERRKRTLRMALAAVRLAEIDQGGALPDDAVQGILQKELKSRQEGIADARQAGRPDLEAELLEEIVILEEYLPQALSEDELEALARQAIAEAGATSAREMGQVMKVLMPRLQRRATGEQASQVVRRLLG